jgi:hypothetical protein
MTVITLVIRRLAEGLPGGFLFQRLSGGFDLTCADAGAARAVQAGQDGAADLAGQVRGGGKDAAGAGDRELRGFDGDLVAGPVGVGTRDGLHGVGDRDPQCLIQRQQCPHLLLDALRVTRAQYPAFEQGVPQREIGDLVFVG